MNKFFDDYDDEDNFFDCYEGYQKRKAQKVKIKEELLPIAWHPSRYWDWCVPEDEKQEIKNCGHKAWVILYLMTGYKNFLTKGK